MQKGRQEIAEELLGCALAPGGFATCPGASKHTKGKGARDFRVVLDGAPTGFCFHSSCSGDVASFNKELRRRIWFAEHANGAVGRGAQVAKDWGVAPEPKAEVDPRPPIDTYEVWEFTRGVPEIATEFLRRRSPVCVESVDSAKFLSALYGLDERVLVFTDQRSQGDFLYWKYRSGAAGRAITDKPDGTYRLSQTQGVKAVPSRLPPGAPGGVWFLVQPVTGYWAINPNSVKAGGDAKVSRRCEATVTAWRYFVLESDELSTEEWLKVVAALRLPIAAIYTSGGRSIHALLKVEVPSKAVWDATRDVIRQMVCPLGADPAALTAVRLSRLPGCRRGDRLQQLLYLDPEPDSSPIWMRKELRA